MQKIKSEIIARDEIEPEIRAAWHFMPYKLTYQGSSINRYVSEIEYECLNCNHKIRSTFQGLERMWSKGYYCPMCLASFDPVFEQKLPFELEEQDEEMKKDLMAEYSIMLGIQEHLKCQPYGFKSINVRKNVRLQHKVCSSIFTATPTMLYKQFTLEDKYTGKPLTTPYCPKCNQELYNGTSYGGARFVERLQNWFTNLKKDFPYKFAEDDIYRFKDYDLPMIVTCKYCDGTFDAKPNELFTDQGDSICPYCDGVPMSEDAGESKIEETKAQQAMEDAALKAPDVLPTDQIKPLEDVKPIPPIEEEAIPAPEETPGMVNILATESRQDLPPTQAEEEMVDEQTEPETEETPADTAAESTEDSGVETGDEDECEGSVPADGERTTEEIVEDLIFGEPGIASPKEGDYPRVVIHKKEPVAEESAQQEEVPEVGVNQLQDHHTYEHIKLEVTAKRPQEDEPVQEETDAEKMARNAVTISNEIFPDEEPVEEKESTPVNEITLESLPPKPETGEIEMVEDPDVYATVDQIAEEIQTQEAAQPDFGGYPLDYTPTEVPQEPAPFANPTPVDTPEIAQLMHPQDPEVETFEEISQSMGEMFEDLGMEPLTPEETPSLTEGDIPEETEEPEIEDDEDDPNLGIPDTEPEDEEETQEVQEHILDAMGELPSAKPQFDLTQSPIGSSITDLAPPSFEGFQMRHGLDIPGMQTPIPEPVSQQVNQIDMIYIQQQQNPPKPVNAEKFDNDWTDLDWTQL